MQEQIEFQPSYATLHVSLLPGESVKAEPGAMIAQSGVAMTTSMSSSLLGGLRRMLAGESFFVNTFTGESAAGWISLSPPSPGDIMRFDLEPGQGNLYIQGSSFLACTREVELDTKFQGMRGMFSGESMFFLRAYAEQIPGVVWCNAYGTIKQVPVTPDEELIIDIGHLVAFTEGINYSIGKVGGIGSMIAGGEGLVMKFRGHGNAWIQTRSLPALADKLIPFLLK